MTFQFGQITAASPFALATAFSPPMLPRPHDSAVVTIRKALDQLPAEVRDGTLEEIALREKTRELIATARRLLSTEWYPLFLQWGEAAARFTTRHESDEAGSALCAENARNVQALQGTRPQNTHDAAFKSYVAAVELTDEGSFGPLVEGHEFLAEIASSGIVEDSPINGLLVEVGAAAWRSDPKHFAWASQVGEVVVRAFQDAQWDRLVSELREAKAEYRRLVEIEREAEQRYYALRPEAPVQPSGPKFLGLEDIENATIAEIKATKLRENPAWVEYDALKKAWAAECDEINRSSGAEQAELDTQAALERCSDVVNALLALPAFTSARVLEKVRIVREEYGTLEKEEMEIIFSDLERLAAPSRVN